MKKDLSTLRHRHRVSQGYYSLTSTITNIEAEPFQNQRLRAEQPETCNNDSFSEGTAWLVQFVYRTSLQQAKIQTHIAYSVKKPTPSPMSY